MDTQHYILIDRFKEVLKNLHNQNSGDVVHEVANMRHLAQASIELLEDGSMSQDEAKRLLESVETKVVQFFMKKYSYLHKSQDNTSNKSPFN